MSCIGIADDFERILEHLSDHEVEDLPDRIGEIIDAIDVLGTSPLIGRPAAGDLRELITGRRTRGYVSTSCIGCVHHRRAADFRLRRRRKRRGLRRVRGPSAGAL